MPVTSVTTDAEALTLTLEADLEAPRERVWHVYTDARQLERFWGPPTYPAKFESFDFRPGGTVVYEMTGPRGEKSRGGWEVLEVNEGEGFTVLDYFLDENNKRVEGLPSMRMVTTFSDIDGGTKMSNVTYFDSLEGLERAIAMGAVEGTKLAVGQVDRVLAELKEFFAGRALEYVEIDDTTVLFTRLIRASREDVWRAFVEPELIQQWSRGPDGWSFTECTFSDEVGGSYRFAWAPDEGTEGEPFALTGELLQKDAPERLVTTESMEGIDSPPSVNDLVLDTDGESTLITLAVISPSAEVKEAVLATGMAEGMEASYARLEKLVS